MMYNSFNCSGKSESEKAQEWMKQIVLVKRLAHQ